MDQPVELLAPARDLECGLTAIACGADAVYIGAPKFGARTAAGNTLKDIGTLVQQAHAYWARVYVTLNTLLRDEEIEEAVELAWRLHELEIDGLIIQDLGLLECKLPPLALIASTQTHNHTPERVAFLERAGFQRAILARELDLDQIRAIRRAAPRIELECFVHGALCVSYSGQCYASYALGGRSGNRGDCAQPCRKAYDLVDGSGRTLVANRHLLSLRDLNLSDSLGELLAAGITSFKVEGRLKDARYVANVVAHYSAQLNAQGVRRSSSGRAEVDFRPDLDKTFNRGYTTYFLHGRRGPIGSHATPKMTGEAIGQVACIEGREVRFDGDAELHAGDGLCFFDRQGELRGTRVNSAAGRVFAPQTIDGLETGFTLYRNYDQRFMNSIAASRIRRRVAVTLEVTSGLELQATDEDGNVVSAGLPGSFPPAKDAAAVLVMLRRQLEKTGDTEFVCTGLRVDAGELPFLPVAKVNAWRRDVLGRLREVRKQNRPRLAPWSPQPAAPFPVTRLSYAGNVLNRHAAEFYCRHGVEQIEPAPESGLDMRGRRIMTTRYCLKYELGVCPKEPESVRAVEPWFLVDDRGNRLELRFDCACCEMYVEQTR